MNLAALDLGSNSFHLLVARVEPDGSLTKVASSKEVLRLGAVVQTHGELPPAVFRDSLEVVGNLARIARAHRAETIVAVGTSALREARNGAEFCEEAAQRHRLCVELLSGNEEGEVVFRGATSSARDLPQRLAVVDIGGGSVEVALGSVDDVRVIESLPLGFLRLSSALVSSGPVTAERVRAAVSTECRGLLERLATFTPDAWLFSGGTARALGKLLINPDGLSARAVARVCEDVSSSGRERLRSLGVDESRLTTLGPGAQVLQSLVEVLGIPRIRIATGGLREGLILRELRRMEHGSHVRQLPTSTASRLTA